MKWEEIQVGAQATMEHSVNAREMAIFRELTGDYNYIHHGRNPIVYGMLTTSFVSALIGEKLPGHGAIIASTSFDYLTPVRIDDVLSITGTVKRKSEARKTMVVEIDIKNQNGDGVVNGTVMVVAP